MTTWVAFLRGVNVGGHRVVKMERLRALFGELGFENVRTYIQSGNVLFDSKKTSRAALEKAIDGHLEAALGFDVRSFVRKSTDLHALIARDPFSEVEVDEDTRLMVMFLSRPLRSVELPLSSPKGDIELIDVTADEALLVLRQRPGRPVDPTPFLQTLSPPSGGSPMTGRFFPTLVKFVDSWTTAKDVAPRKR